MSWDAARQAAFVSAKSVLASAFPLVHPLLTATMSVITDASAFHIGAMLQQLESGSWRPLAFLSAKLSTMQQQYSAFDRELLVVFLAIRSFQFQLEGRHFHLLTDHKPLVATLHQVSLPWSTCQQRQLAYIRDFTSYLRHTLGSCNIVADTLSRPSTPSPSSSFPVSVDGSTLTGSGPLCPSQVPVWVSLPSLVLVVDGAVSMGPEQNCPSLNPIMAADPFPPSGLGIDF